MLKSKEDKVMKKIYEKPSAELIDFSYSIVTELSDSSPVNQPDTGAASNTGGVTTQEQVF